mmetsp:Transcript_4292/g.9355  ORF Transcript_4292/g.9355 Transcript_4292/m.9355 type:complete len:303 (+) Transcript_4292:459-1367(+)
MPPKPKPKPRPKTRRQIQSKPNQSNLKQLPPNHALSPQKHASYMLHATATVCAVCGQTANTPADGWVVVVLVLVDTGKGRNKLALVLIQRKGMNGPVFDLGGLPVEVGEGVFHPVLVVAVGTVLPRVCTTGLLPVLRSRDGGRGAGDQVLQLEGLDEVGVPDQGLVRHGNVLVEFLDDGVDLDNAVLEGLLVPINGGVFLHGLLELVADLRGGHRSLPEPQVVEVLEGFHSLVVPHGRDGLAGRVVLGDLEGAGPSKDDDVEEGVRSQAVGPVDAGGGHLTGGEQSGDGLVLHPGLVLVGCL